MELEGEIFGRKENISYKIIAIIVFFSVSLFCSFCGLAQENTINYASMNNIGSQSVIGPMGIGVGTSQIIPERLESATLILTQPQNLIPYTERYFDQSTVAAIAWWMNPNFYANTSEYRRYLRATNEDKGKLYSPETKIFFDFITKNLDEAINESMLNETLILYRGISGNFADSIIENAEYIDSAFASTAYDITVCLDIFGGRSLDGYQNVLVLQRTGGKDALYINEDEREFLLPRETQWSVIKAINIENLTVESDFPLYQSHNNKAQFNKVRLIYTREKS